MNLARRLRGAAVLLAATACGDASRRPDSIATADSAPRAAASPAVIADRAYAIVRFLQGQGTLPTDALADSVSLIAGTEAGGRANRIGRDQLADRAAWRVPVNGHQASMVPPPTSTRLTVKPGVYIRCMDYALAERVPALAGAPHVGTKLEPPGADSCLQSWNVTLVFDTAGSGRLIAAVYDQWEW